MKNGIRNAENGLSINSNLHAVIFGVIMIILPFILSCNKSNKNGPNSDLFIGNWEKVIEDHQDYGLGGALANLPVTVTTYRIGYVFENTGKGKIIDKRIRTSDGKLEYSYTNEYPIEWLTMNDGKADFIVISWLNGKNTNIDGLDISKTEQIVSKEIYDRNGIKDSVYFRIKNKGALLCRYNYSPAEWELKKE